MAKADSQAPRLAAPSRTDGRPKATASSRYLLPFATAALIGACILVYYLTYVQQNREYLLNRDYRVLATIGEQMSETLVDQMSILTSYVDSFENSGLNERLWGVISASSATPLGRTRTVKRTLGKQAEPKYPPALLNETLGSMSMGNKGDMFQSFAPRLNHVVVRHINPRLRDKNPEKDPEPPGIVRSDGEWSFHLAAFDGDGDHEASATISLEDLAQSFSPSISDTFDDILIAVDDGTGRIVFQKQRIGPHFSFLADLVKNGATLNAAPGEANKDGSVKPGSSAGEGSSQLIETDLAGVPYLVFLEPVTIDVNPGDVTRPDTRRFTLVGLVPSRSFRLQSLAIYYRAVIVFSSVFLLLCLITPILKIVFLNERGRLLRREIVLLPLLFVIIAGALTSICLQTIYFNLRHKDTDGQLDALSRQMQKNITKEIADMRDQLVAACGEITRPDIADLNSPHFVIRTSVLQSVPSGTPIFQEPKYPYFSNIFWTDSNGIQIVKWSATSNATPLIDVSRLGFFRKLDTDNRYFFLDEAKPFRFDSLLPPNQDSYVGVVGLRAADCFRPNPVPPQNEDGYVFLIASPMSLIDPILPLGFGFALVDDTGQVLFHSDKYRNNRENVLQETSYDRELTASLYGHSSEDDFSLDYRGSEVRARVAPIVGVNQSPWSLIVYKDARYSQTYDLEVLTMAGVLLLGNIGIPALLVFCFYLLVRPAYVPVWLWPSREAWHIYRIQILAGMAIVGLSFKPIFFGANIEESLYAAAASGYVTLIIFFESTLFRSRHDKQIGDLATGRRHTLHARTVFEGICFLVAIALVAFPVSQGWRWSVPIGLVPFPFAWALRRQKHLAVAHGRFPDSSYRSLYAIRALILLTVIGILPPLSFFNNSMRLEDRLYIRAAQLQAARDWNLRERKIETQVNQNPELGSVYAAANRCGSAAGDSYLGSYFDTKVLRAPEHSEPSSDLDGPFLRFAHFLHHSYNDIGAEALGVLRNPARNPALPESVYSPKTSGTEVTGSSASPEPEWEWEWKPRDKDGPAVLKLRVHEGTAVSNVCATYKQVDLVVASLMPPGGKVSAQSNLITWLIVTVVMSLLFRLVSRKIFLFNLEEPLSLSAEQVREALVAPGNVLVLTASTQDGSPELAVDDSSRIDVRKLAGEQDWGEKFDPARLPQAGRQVVENFDWELGSPESDQQRLVFIERLVAHSGKVIIVSAVDPLPFLINHTPSGVAGTEGRWAAVLGAFTRINFGDQAPWPLGHQIKKDLPRLWQECSVQPELHRIAEDLWRTRDHRQPIEPEQIVSEVGERAAQYYYLVWRSCTPDECFLLAGLARDGMVNPGNKQSARQLLRRQLIVRDPQFRIMNESFRRFVTTQAVARQEEWDAEAAASGWGKARGPFATALVLVGLFLLATQQQFLQTSSGMLAAAGGGVAALLKLIGVVQGKTSE